MPRNDALHLRRARRAWPKLVDRARSGKDAFTYKQIAAIAGCHHRVAGHFLGDIQRYCAKHKLPRLQALAVNAQTTVPGEGYAGPTGRKKHQRELERVRKHRWPKKCPL